MKDHLTSALAQLNGSADWNERTGGIVSAKLTPFESRDVLFALNELQRRAEIAEANNSNLQMSLRNWIDKCAAQAIRIGDLERDNAALRKAITLGQANCDAEYNLLREQRDDAETAASELMTESERLDWLLDNCASFVVQDFKTGDRDVYHIENTRAAIDAARKEAQP